MTASPPSRRAWALLGLCAVIYGLASAWPAWEVLHSAKGAKDHPSFHYALRQAVAGADPYDSVALARAAHADGTDTEVYPWIYPPPALLAFAWTLPFSYPVSLNLSFFGNQACLAALLALLWRWFKPPPLLLGGVLLAFTPLRHNFQVGQINPAIALLATAGFAWGRGPLLAAAAWIKMSPALLLLPWLLRRAWRPLLGVGFASALLCLATLPLLSASAQLRFFSEVLPALGQGTYNGMDVPLNLSANHSIASVLHGLFPSGDDFHLSPLATWVGRGLGLGLLAPLLWIARRRRDSLGEAALFGAVSALMVASPAYTYEHHLTLLLPATVAAWEAARRRLLSPPLLLLLAVATFGLLWPIQWFRHAISLWRGGAFFIQETKLFGILGLGLVNAIVAARSPEAPPRA